MATGIRKIARKILGRDKIKSIGKEYWQKSAAGSVEKAMKRICDGFDPETFATKKESIVFLDSFKLHPDFTVLEVACGMGRTCRWVAPQVKEYVGVDFIPEMIEKAKKYNANHSNASFYVNDGKTLDMLPNEKFDIVYCELAFQHMLKETQQSYVNEVYRVLKKGGIFFIQVPRMEYYKDSSFASTVEEANKMLQKFQIIPVITSSAYYIVMAKK